MEHGRHIRTAVEAQRTNPPPLDVAEESKRLYEQIGALFGRLQLGDEYGIGSIEENGVQEFADFLDTVRRVADVGRHADRTDRSLALHTAVRRYERDRTGG